MSLKPFRMAIIFFFLAGCLPPSSKEPPPPGKIFLSLEKEPLFPIIDDSDKNSLLQAIKNSLTYLEKKISTPDLPGGLSSPLENITLRKTYSSLALFKEILSITAAEDDFTRKIHEKFILKEAGNGSKQAPIQLTGYFEPIIEGSLERRGDYQYPIYRRPDDLIEIPDNNLPGSNKGIQIGRLEKGELTPYYSRQEIDGQGALKGKGYELAWLKDPWERFILHVQGSGQIRLPDGKILRVGFAASNGRPYRSIGRYLVENGFLPEAELSLGRVKEYLQKNPGRKEEIFNVNERYIFFRPLAFSNQETDGPLGALGFSLTAGRSIATDHSVYPSGALAYLVSQQPIIDDKGKVVGKKPLRRFVLNQDTGAAMKGPGRIDLFCGSGDKAGLLAGEMREEGKIYLLSVK